MNNEYAPKLILLAGLPCSGKTTYATGLADFVHLSTDGIIEEMALAEGKTYDEIFANVDRARVKDIFNQRLDAALLGNKNIIWDECNLTASVREKKLQRVPHHYKKEVMFIHCGLEEVKKRNMARSKTGKTVPINVLMRMFEDKDF